jgi:hypothetical protein
MCSIWGRWDLDTLLRTTKHAVEGPVISCRGRGGTDIGWEVNAGGFLGMSRAYPWTLPGTWKHSSKCKVSCHVTKWTEVSHLHKAARKIIGRCNVLEPQCSIVGKPFRSWNLKLSTIQYTARTLRLRIYICWTPKGSSKRSSYLQMMTRSKKRCMMSGFALSSNRFFLLASESLWTTGQNALRRRDSQNAIHPHEI